MTLQVTDLFDAQAAEAPIHRLVSVLNAQASQISDIQETLRLVQVTQRQTLAAYQTLSTTVSPLDSRVERLESEWTSVKQCQVRLDNQLKALNCQLQFKAERQEVATLELGAKKWVQELRTELCSELASAQVVQSLQTEQNEVHKRLEMMDTRLTSKMEKSEAARLDGVLAQIQTFRPVVTELSSQLKNVHVQQMEFQSSMDTLKLEREASQLKLIEIQQETKQLQQLLGTLNENHQTRLLPQLQSLDETSKHLEQALNEVQTTADSSKAELCVLSATLRSKCGSFFTQLQQHHRHFEHRIQEKASHVETQAQLAELSRQVQVKASETAHKALSSSVKNLRAHCEKLQAHVELSTRFLDWFARRGEAYEHNLELVETHLGRLAQASNPQTRDPFGEQVRFPRSS